MRKKIVFCLIVSALGTYIKAANQNEIGNQRYEMQDDSLLSTNEGSLIWQNSDFITAAHDLSQATVVVESLNNSLVDEVRIDSPCTSNLSDVNSIPGETDSQKTETEFDVVEFTCHLVGGPLPIEMNPLLVPFDPHVVSIIQEIITYENKSLNEAELFSTLDKNLKELRKLNFDDAVIAKILDLRICKLLIPSLCDAIETIAYIFNRRLSVDDEILFYIHKALLKNPVQSNIIDFLRLTKNIDIEHEGVFCDPDDLKKLLSKKTKPFSNVKRPANGDLGQIFAFMD